jgi:diguanylate cyclase (GGDEF)-like protein
LDRPGAGRAVLLGLPALLFAAFLGLRLTAGSEGLPQAGRLLLAAVSAVVLLLVAGWEAIAPRVGRSGAGRVVLFAWFALFALCVHDLFPELAATRLSPVLLFTAAAVFLDPPEAFPVILLSAAAFTATGLGASIAREGAAAAGMGALSLSLNLWSRRRPPLPGAATTKAGGVPEGRILGMVNPWSEEGADPEGQAPTGVRGTDRLVEVLESGLGEILEAARAGSGADAVLYVFRSGDPAAPFRVVAHSLAPHVESVPLFPPDFPPLREALVFGHMLHAEGEEAGRWSVDVGGGRAVPLDRVYAFPVMRGKGKSVQGALCALCFEPGEWTRATHFMFGAAVHMLEQQLDLVVGVTELVKERRQQESLRKLVEGIARAAEKTGDGPADTGAGAATGGAVRLVDGADHRQEVYRLVTFHLREMINATRVFLVEMERGSAGKRGHVASRYPDAGPPGPTADLSHTYLVQAFEAGNARTVVGREGGTVRKGGERRGQGVPVIPWEWGYDPSEHLILVPVRGVEGFEGLLVCVMPRPPMNKDKKDAQDVVSLLRMGLSHVVQVERLHSRATLDGLTGLMNRRTYLERVQQELDRVDRRHPCSLVMLDVDHFKRVNDSYGHPAGDEVLRRISSVIGKTIRKSDLAGRYGGEEFSIFFHNMDKAASLHVVERLRVLVKEVKFDFGGKEVSVTVSLGLAVYPDHGAGAEALVRKADEALYRSKRGGRDRVTLAE